ncbi:hypothetical protein Pedsa_3835 [Pseudopedobacter saltans DSM 12145]|uniref:Uncharacterized protein n=1 Tax=Pseudopedobacter saltans (strain ATCC 51119 / DSM 12145 / JCM 21818 / CCUG 39354 / LMG 10337 / NBRC 100064 / NCIMB 13643) TaxID=762903 RepID=F0S790_PSESL|nr:hypothetical protein [Pseudopedobacter saltans]ADY54363.1 hypothetical protein Pedsa_3835 [Pseudopedobacter saltans DSM 12145]
MRNTLVITFIYFLITSCSSKKESDNCIYEIDIPAIEISTESSGTVNEPIIFKVKLSFYNGCSDFKIFEEKKDGNIITVVTKGMNMGCICTDIAFTLKKDYTFIPKTAGTYTFKFKSSGDTYIQKQVILN